MLHGQMLFIHCYLQLTIYLKLNFRPSSATWWYNVTACKGLQ